MIVGSYYEPFRSDTVIPVMERGTLYGTLVK